MNCKFCGAALEENVTVCPACGEVVTANNGNGTPNKSSKIIAIALAAVVLVGVIAAGLWAFGGKENTQVETTGASVAVTTEATEAVTPTAPELVITEADLEAIANADVVVATLGDAQLTNGMLQMYYGRAIWDMVEEYGSYLSYFGLDLTQPLDTQAFPYEEGTTWHEYFLEMALDSWLQNQTLVNLAQEANYQFPEGLETYLESLKDTLDQQAVLYGYADGDALVQAEMGANTSVELYKAYSETYNKAAEYYGAMFEAVQFTAAEVEAYFDQHADELYEMYYVTKDPNPVIDVRHILLIPADSTEEAKAACLQQAQALLEQWKNGEATEESFAQLANEHSQDPGSNTVGGLYEFVYQGDMVDTFDAWCFDESRKSGDTGIVETTYGYHIMYFVYGADEWFRAAQQAMTGDRCNEQIAAAAEQYGFAVDYEKISLCTIRFA